MSSLQTPMLLLGLQYGGETCPWDSAVVMCLIIFGVVKHVVFFVVEWKVSKYPNIPLRHFRKASTCATLGLASVHGFAFLAPLYFITFSFQVALGATPILSAVWLLPHTPLCWRLSRLSREIIKSTSPYLDLILSSMFIATLGLGLLIDVLANVNWPRIIIYLIITAIGLGPNFQAPRIAMSEVLQAGIAESLVNSIVGGATAVSSSVLDQLRDIQRGVVSAAVGESLSKTWTFDTCAVFLGFIATLGIGRVELSKKHEEHKTGLAVEEFNRLANEKKRMDEEKTTHRIE